MSFQVGQFKDETGDLEWALLSGQVATEAVLEALLEAYEAPLFRLANALLHDPADAGRAAEEIFVRALLEVHAYRGQGADVWLFSIAFSVLRRRNRRRRLAQKAGAFRRLFRTSALREAGIRPALEALDDETRLILLLQTLLDWPVERIARLLQKKESKIEDALSRGYRFLKPRLVSGGNLPGDFSSGELAEYLQTPEQEGERLEGRHTAILARIRKMDSRRVRLSATGEAGLTLVGILLAVVAFVGAARFLPDPAGSEAARQTPEAAVAAGGTQDGGPADEKIAPAAPIGLDEGFLYLVKPGDSQIGVAERFRVPLQALRRANGLSPGDALQAGRQLVIPVQPSRKASRVAQAPPALSRDASSREIYQRLIESQHLWDTLWIDAQVTFGGLEGGPQGYLGTPQTSRVQAWFDRRSSRSLILSGRFGRLEEIFLQIGDQKYFSEPGWNGDARLRSLPAGKSLRSPYLGGLLLRPAYVLDDPGLTFQAAGPGRTAGFTRALAVDVLDLAGARKARLWMDREVGLALRQVLYARHDDQAPLLDVEVLNVEVDPRLPESLFDPQAEKPLAFAAGPQTFEITNDARALEERPITHAYTAYTVPPDIDWASSSLNFRVGFRYRSSPDYEPPYSSLTADVFASGVYMGTAAFGNPWTMICDRSPDGHRLAFADQIPTSRGQISPLRWLEISRPEEIHSLLDHLYVSHMAFAPDSRRLAFFGKVPSASGSVYVADLENGDYRRFLHLAAAGSFVWSPDGKYLAMIAREVQEPHDDLVLVIDTASGGVTYRRSFGLTKGPRQDWPPARWQVPFPQDTQNLEDCARPMRE